MTTSDPRQEFGPNAGVVQALRERWLADPNSVPNDWQEYFTAQAAAAAAEAEPPPTDHATTARDASDASGEPAAANTGG